MKQVYTSPEFNASAFNCPNCGAFASQNWNEVLIHSRDGMGSFTPLSDTQLCFCSHCNKPSIWYNEKIIHPDISTVPLPNNDLPDDIKNDYNEARSIVNRSPRGGAALLRLAIQKLCVHLGEPGKNINTDIKELVKKGLEPRIQKALDIVRVIGNNAVHPGQIDLSDDQDTASKLFNLINLIADVMITRPNELDKLYSSLPEEAREAIEKRDQAT